MKKSLDWAFILRSIVVPTVLGLVAGVAGALTAESYLAADSYRTPEIPKLGRPTVAVTAPIPAAEVGERLAHLNLPVVLARALKQGAVADRAVGASEAVGYAVALTSDGWLATHPSVLASGPVLVAVDGRLFAPTSQVSDPATGLVFLHVDAAALQVSAFEDTELLRRGTALHYSDAGGLYAETRFAGALPLDGRTGAVPSDRFWSAFRLGSTWGAKAAGGAVLTGSGNLAGVLLPPVKGETSGVFVPTHRFRSVLSDVFKGEKPRRAVFGVQYLDLDSAAVAGEAAPAEAGALLSAVRRTGAVAVAAGSSAARAGLKEGDVILRLDNVDIAGERDLSELLAGYDPGARVAVEYQRGNERLKTEATLD